MHDAPLVPDLTRHRLVFVGGLHRSGTTLLADVLAQHPRASGLAETGVPHDEGQHLQDVFPTARDAGGPGRFAFDPGAHLTEDALVGTDPDDARDRLLAAWAPYWDLDKPVLVEKSPPNLLRFRYLQALFPDAAFVAVVRHPVAVAYATEGWSKTGTDALLEHWLHAHEVFEQDRPHLRQLFFVRYEDFVGDVDATLAQLDAFLGLAPHGTSTTVRADTNRRYLRRWRHSRVIPASFRIARHARRFEARLRALGYGYSVWDRP